MTYSTLQRMEPGITKNDHVKVPGVEEREAEFKLREFNLEAGVLVLYFCAIVILHNVQQRQLKEELGSQCEGTARHDQEGSVAEV